MAAGSPLAVLGKAVLGMVRQNIAARCPAESVTDIMVRMFNDDSRQEPSKCGVRGTNCTVHVCIHMVRCANPARR